MKKTIRVLLSVVMVLAMMAGLTVCAFADGAFTFTGNGDVTFKFGGKTVSMAKELGVTSFDPYGLRGICQSFCEVADQIPLDYTASLTPSSAEFTINTKDFICAFIAENVAGSNGYVKVVVLADSDELPIDNAKLYVFKGKQAVDINSLPNADAILGLALEDGCTVVKLTKEYIPFLDDAAGFTICAAFQKKDGTVIASYPQSDTHTGYDYYYEETGNNNNNNNKKKDTDDGVLVPWKFWNYGKSNDHKVDLNVGPATFEFGNKGFDIQLHPQDTGIQAPIEHPDLSVDMAHPNVGNFNVNVNDVLQWMFNAGKNIVK